VVCNDLTTNKDFVPLTYASDLFIHLRAFLQAYDDDPCTLDNSLKALFPSCQSSYPYIPLSKFKEVMVNQVKLEFSHDEEYNRREVLCKFDVSCVTCDHYLENYVTRWWGDDAGTGWCSLGALPIMEGWFALSLSHRNLSQGIHKSWGSQIRRSL
jgi:hypothetical protein